ncbi:MAG: glutamine-hydrolyzing carbamoyl-phosphate synthase small subunit [Candidatus Aminicenantes bacterium]|nr:glutamine-hydrolyzing carbamoyl-phosphate synthase small subunit [Candidatus Aminicenantes bacterium]
MLSDGTIFEGLSFGAEGETIGEVVFNTSMTGYQEIITDSSYKGQLVVMTYTQIGNYGVNIQDIESSGPKVEGFIVKECIDFPSNWRSEMCLTKYLRESNIVGIEGIDTRVLTRHLRDNGVQMGVISTADLSPENLLKKVRQHPGISSLDLVKDVTTKEPYRWEQTTWKWQNRETLRQEIKKTGGPSWKKIIVYDFGIKLNILRHLAETGCDLTIVPAHTAAEEVLKKADGIVLSNGPGDPQTVTYAVETAKKLIGKKPLLGICLGHQIIGLALGGRTYKLKFGHHGGNHPVMDLSTRKVEITSQNHNYCVDIGSLGGKVMLTHNNLYDGTEEGMKHKDLPVMSIQYHPEAGPGPNDSRYIFRRFKEMVDSW